MRPPQYIDKYELIRKWYAALMSGDYKQIRRRLQGDGGYCCLGVLCHVAGYEDADGYKDEIAGQIGNLPSLLALHFDDDDPNLTIPAHILKSMPVDHPSVYSSRASAAILNDSGKYSFEQIAACVKATWPEAFEAETGQEPKSPNS